MTRLANSRGVAILVAGDLIAFLFSLILTLAIRYGSIPGRLLLLIHLPAFSILFILFVLVNLSAGLYDKQAAFLQSRMRGLLLKAQVMNVLVGVIFFYFAPVSITPKVNLFIFFVVSTAVLFFWRTVMFPVLSSSRKQGAILVGEGIDIQDLSEEITGNVRYGLNFSEHVIPKNSVNETVQAIADAVKKTGASVIVADLHNPTVESAMPFLYSLIFSGVQVIDASKLYESIFDRIPLSMVGERWLVENSASALGSRRVYDTLKRIMDIALAGLVGLLSLVFYPFVCAAIKLEDRGPVFISQERIGKNGKSVRMFKFRSMSGNDSGRYGTGGTTAHVVTRVGSFLRRSRIDELPQLWNVVRGDLSLIGPRPEFPSLVGIYDKEIPYYNARHLVKPGLSGWAQIYHEAHPHHAVATEETRDKLSYDLYYIKNRSLMLDLKIALRTLQIVIGRSGR